MPVRPTMTPAHLNTLDGSAFVQTMLGCCGAKRWGELMSRRRPYDSATDLHDAADLVFNQFVQADWLEAFSAHPCLGDMNSLSMAFHGNQQWSAGEQAGVNAADEKTFRALAKGNTAYERRFGYIFILCATGKSVHQMLDALNQRLQNTPDEELTIAASQQRQITHLRIDKLLSTD